MSDHVAVEATEVAKPKKFKKKKSERLAPGTLPPYLTLSDAFPITISIYQQGGGRASADTMSEILGNSSSSSSYFKKVNALKAYGLVTEQAKTVALTAIGLAVAAPDSPASAGSAKKEAMLKIDLFNKLYERHKGKILPDPPFLKNIIERDLKVSQNYSEIWMATFKDALSATGLASTRSDGKIQIRETANIAGITPFKVGEVSPPPPPPKDDDTDPLKDSMPVLLGMGKVARIHLPKGFDANSDLLKLLQILALSLGDGSIKVSAAQVPAAEKIGPGSEVN